MQRLINIIIVLALIFLGLAITDYARKTSRTLKMMFGAKRVMVAKIEKNNFVTQDEIRTTSVSEKKGIKQNRDHFDKIKLEISNLGSCLQEEDRCGQKTDKEYFDPDRTPEHHKLNQALTTMLDLVSENSTYYNEINRNEIIRLTSMNNTNTPILAVQILMQGEISHDEYSELLRNAKYLRGNTRAMYLSILAVPEELRPLHVKAVLSALTNKEDRYTALEVQKNLGQYRLDQQEFVTAIKKSCYLSNDGSGENLWPMLRRNIVIQSQSMGFVINPDDYCKL